MADRIHFNTGRAVRDLLIGVPAENVFRPIFKGARLPEITPAELSEFRIYDSSSTDPKKVVVGTILTAASLDIAASLKSQKTPEENPPSLNLGNQVDSELLTDFLVPRFLNTVSTMYDVTDSFTSGLIARPHLDAVLESLNPSIKTPSTEVCSILGEKLKTGSQTLIDIGEDYQPLLTTVYKNFFGEIPTLEQLLKLVTASTGIFRLGASKDTRFLLQEFQSTFVAFRRSSVPNSPSTRRVFKANNFTIGQSGSEPAVVPCSIPRVEAEQSWSKIKHRVPIYITGCPVRVGITYPDRTNEPSLIQTVAQKHADEVQELAA